MPLPIPTYLQASTDLVTSYEATRAGFVALALERNFRASPFVAEARALKAAVAKTSKPSDLVKMKSIQPALLTAAGVSEKAASHLEAEDKVNAIRGLIETFLEPAGIAFVEELVFRFLLTRGDTLGGSMRNVGGALAERKLTRAILAALALSGSPVQWLSRTSRTWQRSAPKPSLIDDVSGLSLDKRTLRYNLTVPLVGKNIDLCLFNCKPAGLDKDRLADPNAYVLLGELKGGIDPAGADEHWKTAGSALTRIRSSFAKHNATPALLFVGAAIARSMADEMFSMVVSGTLSNAANLNDEDQVAAVCDWLVKL
jgi:hypothetical protein